jgi:hypothetical protein
MACIVMCTQSSYSLSVSVSPRKKENTSEIQTHNYTSLAIFAKLKIYSREKKNYSLSHHNTAML